VACETIRNLKVIPSRIPNSSNDVMRQDGKANEGNRRLCAHETPNTECPAASCKEQKTFLPAYR
jgi:hypothetical protein